MLPIRKLALSSASRSPFVQLRHASSSSPTSPHPKSNHGLDSAAFWTPLDGLPVIEFANVAFFSMDRPLLELYNEDHSKWERTNSWIPSTYQPYHPPPTPDTQQHYSSSSASNDPESNAASTTTSSSSSTSTTTTITLDISRVDGQLQVVSSEVLGQEQVADYLVAMQQRWEQQQQLHQQQQQQQKRRSMARKRYLLRKKGFFEKN